MFLWRNTFIRMDLSCKVINAFETKDMEGYAVLGDISRFRRF